MFEHGRVVAADFLVDFGRYIGVGVFGLGELHFGVTVEIVHFLGNVPRVVRVLEMHFEEPGLVGGRAVE